MKRNPPKKDAQINLFMPAFGDIAARDGIDMMEFPFFSLSKKKRFKAIRYENERRGISVTVSGGEPNGIATIWDKDILIWCISQVREALDRGEEPQKIIHFHPYQLLKAVRRGTRKDDYERMESALVRLGNTAIHTSIRTEEVTYRQGFHWIEKYTTARQNKTGEGAGMWSIHLSDWIYEAAVKKSLILSLDDDYFLLTGGRERWLYLVARKHGGYQDHGFTMPMSALYGKSGTSEKYKFWAHEIRQIVKADELPGYHLSIWRSKDKQEYINFTRRNNLSFDHPAYEMDLPRALEKRRLSHL